MLVKYLLFLFLTVVSIKQTFALTYAGNPNHCGTMCANNMDYYGRPHFRNQFVRPVYPFPQMRFHSIMGPRNYYYRPYSPSPYRPQNCISCEMRYRQFQSPFNGQGTGMPMTYYKVKR